MNDALMHLNNPDTCYHRVDSQSGLRTQNQTKTTEMVLNPTPGTNSHDMVNALTGPRHNVIAELWFKMHFCILFLLINTFLCYMVVMVKQHML